MNDTFHLFFFFKDTATTKIYTLSLHDALPISEDKRKEDIELAKEGERKKSMQSYLGNYKKRKIALSFNTSRSEEHTSELKSRQYLVCRLLLEKKKKIKKHIEEDNHTHSPNGSK